MRSEQTYKRNYYKSLPQRNIRFTMVCLRICVFIAIVAFANGENNATDSFTPGASVRCLKDTMYIDLRKNVLNGYSELDLTLSNGSCRATSNRTHFSLKAPLMGCGTEAKFTEEAVVYSNLVKEYRRKGMITRIQDIRIPFSCFYTKEGVTSTFGLLPTKVRRILDGGNATTRFELAMSLFRDKSFSLSYGVGDFPLKVTVNRPLYVQVSIDSPDKRLSVMADRCYATPTQNPDHVMQYDIVNDGCAVDPTVEFYKGNYNVQRFSFKAFQFISEGKQFVYIHCHLIVCNASNPTSRCSQGCLSSFGRLRRSVDSAAEADLTQGPIIMESRPSALGQKSSGSPFEKYVWIMVGMGGFCIICLIIMMYLKRQISLHRKMPLPDPDRETDV